MNEVETAPESQRKEIVIIKIANGYVVAPGMYCGDIDKSYAADVDAALAMAKNFLA